MPLTLQSLAKSHRVPQAGRKNEKREPENEGEEVGCLEKERKKKMLVDAVVVEKKKQTDKGEEKEGGKVILRMHRDRLDRNIRDGL